MSRELAFWNDETIALVREHFVAAAVPTWVARSDGPEGEFLRRAEIDRHWVTSSGYMNCVSASGRLLGRKPSQKTLAAFEGLPEAERAPGAIEVRDLRPDEASIPAPPNGGLILRVHARFLARDEGGGLRRATTDDFPLVRDDPDKVRLWRKFLEPNSESAWLLGSEWRALIPDDPEPGDRIAVDSAIPMRLARFHLNPKRATTSEGAIVRERDVRAARVDLVVENVAPQTVRMRIEGKIAWGSEFDAALATSPNGPLPLGFEAPLRGWIEVDRSSGAVIRFDLVAAGDVWGRWGDANNHSMDIERPGRQPFGFAVELGSPDTPAHRIPPGGNGRYVSEGAGYFPAPEGP